MATKKASSSKAARKRPATKKPAEKVAIKATTVAAKTGGKKLTFGEKVAAIRPGVLIAEFFGTFVLAAVMISLFGGGTTGAIVIALTLAVLVIVFGAISGAHVNPAITIAQYVNRKIDGVRAVAYIAVQVLGALAAFGLMLGMFNAATPSLEAQVYESLTGNGYVAAKDIDESGGIVKYLSEVHNMTVDEAAGQLGITATQFVNHKMTADKEWVDLMLELVAAIVFGLGIGYAVCAQRKSAIETGFAVGISLLAAFIIGGSTVILNPAVAAAIGGFEAVNPFTAGAMAFWWPVFTYIGATTVGITAGFTVYRLILKDVVEK
ncbi:MAG: aquaporin [Candidatus Nomurabacteria bacterium]|jgi:glycerol uptake facilitator-like aquaporin|nr:aquaporin [Candidatus Nomurabacteria bacterium]